MPDLVKEDAEKGLVWRTDLRATIPFWEKWFENFNECFSNLLVRRWLVLTNPEGVDGELFGQMERGKFAMFSIPGCGHNIQEDKPAEFGQAIVSALEARKVPKEWDAKIYITNASGQKVLISR